MYKKKRILIAVGGTGGHLFPAQALANKIISKDSAEILFVGGKLSTNRFFNKERFVFKEVSTSTISKRNPFAFVRSAMQIGLGVRQSIQCIKEFAPDLVIGFGSYYTFPSLVAACICRVPFILHEQNTIPGKVNRLFAKKALWTAISFPETGRYIKGQVKQVNFSVKECTSSESKQEALAYFGLDDSQPTVLVFGGSQGAKFINNLILEASTNFNQLTRPFQILHFIGKNEEAEKYKRHYQDVGVKHVVKEFESRIDLAWKAADFAITRAGASSIGELMHFEVPSLLIPFSHATDDHQTKNGDFVVKTLKGGLMKQEYEIDAKSLLEILQESFSLPMIERFKSQIHSYKQNQRQDSFEELIFNYIEAL